MCGIAGFFGFEDKKLIKKMCDVISHRGPDDKGYHIDRNVCLGNRRLGIIDLSGGKQPIYNEDGSIVIVFNGEIYNYREIQEELKKKGHKFKTSSDTEVLVHGYEEYGHEILEKVNGMFGFAIWDSNKKELFIARDRVGIKPIYYYWDGEVLVFGSEIKSLIECKRIPRKVSDKAVYRFLTLRYIPGDITIFESIKKLKPGHYLKVRDKKLEVKEFWDVGFGKEIKSFDECKKRISELLTDSVKKRMISDVPLGAFLSGGIDSSIIVGTMSKFSDKVKTFSVGFSEEEYSELDSARVVSEHFNTDHHEIVIDPEKFIKILPKIVWHMDEPLADPTAIPTYYVSRLARKKVKVVLSGEGGDETFGGYPKYGMQRKEAMTKYYLKSPSIGRNIVRKVSPGKYNLYLDSLETAERFYLAPAIKDAKLLEEQAPKGTKISEDIKDTFKPYQIGGDIVREMQYVDIKTWLPEELLMKVDKMSMARSLEARVPFLDHRMIDLSMMIPSRFKIQKGIEKYILRKTFSDLVPKSTLVKKKQGFSVPVKEWVKDIEVGFENKHVSKRMMNNSTDLKLRCHILQLWFKEFHKESN